jgi:hypothetical protein
VHRLRTTTTTKTKTFLSFQERNEMKQRHFEKYKHVKLNLLCLVGEEKRYLIQDVDVLKRAISAA